MGLIKRFKQKTKRKLDSLLSSECIKNLYIMSAQTQIQSLLGEIKSKNPNRLELYGYKVYSQNEEDGIIEEIFKRIGTTNKTFLEIGVGNGLENNTYFLLFKGWSGAWIEGHPKCAKSIRENFAKLINIKRLLLIETLVYKDNITQVLSKHEIPKNVDLFSIDIDGNDFYVLEMALQTIEPRVIVAEYNAKFPPDVDWCMEYNDKHWWTYSDKFGMALKTLTEMLQKRGYSLVGTNITGANAFYVKKDLVQDLFASVDDIATLYNPARYHLTPAFISGHPAKEAICDIF